MMAFCMIDAIIDKLFVILIFIISLFFIYLMKITEMKNLNNFI